MTYFTFEWQNFITITLSGFIGTKCNMVNPCERDSNNHTLHNCVHGTCINPRVVKQPSGRELSQHDCECFDGYTGQQCIHMVEKPKSLSLSYIIGPSVALLLVCIVLSCMLFFFVAKNRRANQGTYSPSNQESNGARVPVSKVYLKILNLFYKEVILRMLTSTKTKTCTFISNFSEKQS